MVIHPLLVIMIFASFAGAFFLFVTLQAVRKFKLFPAVRDAIITLICFLIMALSGICFVANHGYRAFTREVLAATVSVEPTGKQQFTAKFILPDSTTGQFAITGDMLYVDAHILKWHPLLNLFGIHTTYELDRVGGRYHSLDDEKTKPRTLYSLSKSKVLNMYSLRLRWMALKPLLDAEYGSATYVSADAPATFKIMVSTSGLLVREAKGEGRDRL